MSNDNEEEFSSALITPDNFIVRMVDKDNVILIFDKALATETTFLLPKEAMVNMYRIFRRQEEDMMFLPIVIN